VRSARPKLSASSRPEADVPADGVGSFILEWWKNGAPDRIRTCGLCLRRATLYPAELRAQSPARTTGRLLLERAAKKWKPVFRRKGARRIRPDRIAQTGMRIGGERMRSRDPRHRSGAGSRRRKTVPIEPSRQNLDKNRNLNYTCSYGWNAIPLGPGGDEERGCVRARRPRRRARKGEDFLMFSSVTH
jgi:hypothetical protein